MKKYSIIDATQRYHSIMVFDMNKNVPIHRWYPFVEGYSKEFIEDILTELDHHPESALEPFCGSGTTPVELQEKGIKCYSFEVSPFMYLLAQTKLCQSYKADELIKIIQSLTIALSESPKEIRTITPIPFGSTIVNTGRRKKFNFHDSALDGLLDVRYAINQVVREK